MGSPGRGKVARFPIDGVSISDMPSGNLPEEIMVNILSRLPVKSLLRFRSVCKPWLSEIRSPKFIKMHLDQTAKNPSLIVQSFKSESWKNFISLFHLDSLQNGVPLKHPYPLGCISICRMLVVGSCNGIVCLSNPQHNQFTYLWNPATKQSKHVRQYNIKVNQRTGYACLGFGFDPDSNDYKVVRIVFKADSLVGAEVYSLNADSWRKIEIELQIELENNICNAIVKGNPYWKALDNLVVSFDVRSEVFRQISLPNVVEQEGTNRLIVEFRDSVAMIVYSQGDNLIKGLSLWTMDDDCGRNGSWTKKFTVEAVPGMEFLFVYLKAGEIVGGNKGGEELFLYDPKNKETKNVRIPVQAHHIGVYSYTESLFSIKGSKQVK